LSDRAASGGFEPIVLKNSVFGENRIIIRLKERPTFGDEGVGQFGQWLLLCQRYASPGRSVPTFGFNGPLPKNHRSQISEFFNKISPFQLLLRCPPKAGICGSLHSGKRVHFRESKVAPPHPFRHFERPDVWWRERNQGGTFPGHLPRLAI